MHSVARIAVLSLAALPLFAAQTESFDANWRFLKSDAPGAEQPAFDDASWRTLNLPHDWSIEGPFDPKNPSGQAGAFLPNGIGWYRKSFTLPAADSTRRTFIDFDGVMANSDVWINGFHLGKRPYGYISFRYELTAHLNFGPKANVIAVRADDDKQPASRWYPGAGIYRHVWLVTADPVHLAHWSTFVSTPKAAADGATVHVETDIENQSPAARTVSLAIRIVTPSGRPAAADPLLPSISVAPGKPYHFSTDIPVGSPDLWDLAHPALYRAVVSVRDGRKVLDEETVTFGIRDAHFDAATGFWLNGHNFKLKGVCLHADGGMFGAAVPLRIWERRLEQLRAIGVNAMRTAHNPPAPEFLALCDRMGFLVMDELFDCWTVGKTPYDYHLYFTEWSRTDARDAVLRDRNHPSIIMYSAGNEIHDTPKAQLAKDILSGLVATFHAADPTRPVTQALFRPNVSHDYDDGLADLLDVVGQNYRENEILAANVQKPTRKILGTENGHTRQIWLALRDNAPYAGQFIWAGIDYLGEAHAWPFIASSQGILDRTGGFKPESYERQSWWSDAPNLHVVRRVAPERRAPTDPGYELEARPVQTLFADWTPANLAAHPENVEVYSNCPSVELTLNGKSLGSKPLPPDASARTWRVDFEPGAIAAVCQDGKTKDELRTAGKPAGIRLTADRTHIAATFDDLSFLTATIIDKDGTPVPSAELPVTFAVTGSAVVAATDNADNTSHESFQSPTHRAYNSWCVAAIKAIGAGAISVKASAPGLAPAAVSLEGRSK